MAITVASLDLRVSLVFMVSYLLCSHLHLGGLIERVIALYSYGKDSNLECQSHFDKILAQCSRTEHRTKWKIVEFFHSNPSEKQQKQRINLLKLQ